MNFGSFLGWNWIVGSYAKETAGSSERRSEDKF